MLSTDSAENTESAAVSKENGIEKETEKSINNNAADNSITEAEAAVYVCGAVKNPGVYYLKENSRITDAVEAAGGFLEEAVQTSVNLADFIRDGQMIYIFAQGEEQAEAAVPALVSDYADSGKVNINTAGRKELMTLPGIGDAKAEAILSYRSVNGAFQTIEEIQNVSGIKSSVFSKIRDLICV